MRKDMTALQWLAPSMARDGLIKNCEWIEPACAAAVALFSDPRLHLPATFLAALGPYAVDYIKQAPALVVAATWDARLIYRKQRLRVAKDFIAACGHGPRLNELLKRYGLATPLRALSGQVLRHGDWGVLRALSGIPATTLAQSIPTADDGQRRWLDAIQRWREHMRRHCRDEQLLLAWAAANLADVGSRRGIGDVADFASHNRATFNTRWSFAQAKAASDRWHAEVLRRPFGIAALSPDWRVKIDYSPLPAQVEVGGLTFLALQTREDIFIEGDRMHHCVRTYADRVAKGHSRLYSVRRGDQRIATLELWPTGSLPLAQTPFVLAQLKGPCNAKPPQAVVSAANAFVDRANSIALARSGASSAIDPQLQEARQAIHDACLARVAGRGRAAA
jgi:PcfJ-like protein